MSMDVQALKGKGMFAKDKIKQGNIDFGTSEDSLVLIEKSKGKPGFLLNKIGYKMQRSYMSTLLMATA